MTSSKIQPSVYVKHFAYNLNSHLYHFIFSRICYDLSQHTKDFSTSYSDEVFDCSMSRSRFNLRYLLVMINHFQGDNLYEKVCNYFLINPLHSNPIEFLTSCSSVFDGLDCSFISDIYYYLLYIVVHVKMKEEDFL